MKSGIRRVFRVAARDEASVRSDVDEEMLLHIHLRTEQLVSEGVDREQAGREAERMFAGSDETLRELHRMARERSRHMWKRHGWDGWRQDLRYAARGLMRDRLTSGFIVLALTLGIGANVTAVTILDRILLRGPAHVSAPERLVRIYGTRGSELTGDVTSSWIPHGSYEQLHAGARTLERVAAYRVTEQAVGRGMEARQMRVAETLGDYFGTLGTRAFRGRLFQATENETAAGHRAVVSETLWSALGGDEGIVGQSLPVGNESYTIVGVAPRGFTGAEMRRVDVWVLGDERRARSVNWTVIGRMAQDVSREAVDRDVAQVHARATEAVPRWFREARLSALPVTHDAAGREPFEARMARWLTAISLVILMVAFGNVVNLLLARSARRRRELAVRAALGSGRGRLLRLIGLEGALLSVAAGLLSLLVVRALEPPIRTVLLAGDAPWTLTLLDARLLLVLLAVVLLSVIVIGLVPALQAGSANLTGFLREDDHGGPRGARTRAALTILQASMSVVLLVGAGLFIRSLDRVRAVDLGVDREAVLVARADLAQTNAATQAEHELTVLRGAAEAVSVLPGVQAAAVAVGLPLDGGSFSASLFVPGRDSVPSSQSGPFASAVGPGYFETIGTSVLRGRGFADADAAGAAPVLVINATMAERLWPGADAIDQCVRVGDASAPCARIVGVVQDVHRIGLNEAPSLQFYMPLSQQDMFSGAVLLIRPTQRAPISSDALRRSIVSAHPSIRTVELEPLSAALDGEMRPLRLGMLAFGLSGALALVIAVLGLYSVMAYMVAWRTREIGVRVALGATRSQIIRMIMLGGGRLAAIGVAGALVAVLVGGRWLEPYLFQTSAADPLVLGAVAAAILAVSAVAGWVPAARAVRIDPTQALRS